MPSRLMTITFDAPDPARPAQFWSGLLDREVAADGGGVSVPGDETQVGLRFVPARSDRRGPNRLHLHLTSASLADQEHTVAKALKLGASHLDVGQRPEDGHIVLADPDGNAFCVIEPDNNYLSGCGFLGEVACDGTREVGLFWSEALGWPLVWDENEETAVQSPQGGTKVAWGGPPVEPKIGPNRQWFDLAPVDGDQAAEIDRLVSIGATRLEIGPDGTATLADPDGNEFCLTP